MKPDDVKLLNEYLKLFITCKNSAEPDSATVKKYWCDKSTFFKAKIGSLDVLIRNFGSTNIYVTQLSEKVRMHELGDVEVAIGIIEAVLFNESNKK